MSRSVLLPAILACVLLGLLACSSGTDPVNDRYRPGDLVPPAAVLDLRVLSSTDSTVTLGWTAPGDDGTAGQASRYEMRCDDVPIAGDAGWEAADEVSGLPAPGASGATDSALVAGLVPGVENFFALRSADEVPNWSEPSNLLAYTTEDPDDPDDPEDPPERWEAFPDLSVGSGDNVLAIYDDLLFLGAHDLEDGSGAESALAAWDGVRWSNIGPTRMHDELYTSTGEVMSLAVYHFGGYREFGLYVGGWFDQVDDVAVNGLAVWDGDSWTDPGWDFAGEIHWEGRQVIARRMCVHGNELHVFATVSNALTKMCVYSFQTGWRYYDLPAYFHVADLVEYGNDLVAAGPDGIYRWTGEEFEILWYVEGVRSLAVFRGELVAGGLFDSIGGNSCGGVARYDGQAWRCLGSGFVGLQDSDVGVRDLHVAGNDLFAAGHFAATAEDTVLNHVARWGGDTWTPLGTGLAGNVYQPTAFAWSVLDYEDALYVTGQFARAGSIEAWNLARWNGLR